MTQKIPSYLKLHIESAAPRDHEPREDIPGLNRLCEAFHEATGLTLEVSAKDTSAPAPLRLSAALDDDARLTSQQRQLDSPDGRKQEHRELTAFESLAASIQDILQQFQQTRVALWHREAELAAGVPVTQHPDEQLHLAARLEAVLKAGARSVGCQASAAYLLDETSRHLKLRACWGLPKSRFLDPPRPLRGAAADLEALVGHAVVLEDTALLADWNVPEEFRSAACVPISTPTTPLGTLWVYCDHPREFTTEESSLLEIVSGRIAADLEREMLLQQTLDVRSIQRQLRYASQWQDNRLPRIKPMLNGWQIAGRTTQGDHLGGDFHDWFVLPDGALAVVVGDAQGKLVEAGLTAAALHTAVKAHANYRHSAQQLVERVNETLWAASAGDQFASLFYALLQPDTGRLECAAAGHVYASAVGRQLRPLAAAEESPLGTQPDAVYPVQIEHLEPNDSLVVFSEGYKRSLKPGKAKTLWRLVDRHHDLSADDLTDRLEEFAVQNARDDAAEDRTLLVIKRSKT
ncbi:MAG: SpoIIE family protein phosphatase [Pirellulaceae bacterium]|nr:SpoIIE family protein phosphatase [Pirellulaceae bacterium]